MLAGAYESQRAPTSSSTVRTDNQPKVRFWVTGGEKPDVELGLI